MAQPDMAERDDSVIMTDVQSERPQSAGSVSGSVVSADHSDNISEAGEFDELLDDLMAIDVVAKRATKTGKTRLSFDLEEAKFVVKTMAQEIGAKSGIERLNKLMEEYKTHPPGATDIGVATRAEALSESDSVPQQARPLFRAFSRLERTLRHEGSTLKSFRAMVEKVNFVNAYHFLVMSIDDKAKQPGIFDESLCRTFRELGMKGKWTTVARDYLAMECGVERSIVAELINEAAGIHQMVQYFGPGIICLVPETMAKRYVYLSKILIFID